MAEHCTLTSVSSYVALFSHCRMQRWCWDWAIPGQAFITVTPRWHWLVTSPDAITNTDFITTPQSLLAQKLYRITGGFLCRAGYALFLSRMSKSIISCLSLKASSKSPLSSCCHRSRIIRHCPCKRLPLILVHFLWNGWPFLSRLLVKADTINIYCIVLYCIVLYCIVLYCILNKKFIWSYLFIGLFSSPCVCVYVCMCVCVCWYGQVGLYGVWMNRWIK
jgi:hypothetical protein